MTRLTIAALFAGLFGALPLTAIEPPPQLPCGESVYPEYPDVDHTPAVKAWARDQLGTDWKPPACTGWTETGFSTLVVVAARIHAPNRDALLTRLGAISELKGIQYWSTTHQKWRTLIVDAFASRRADFSPAELTEGKRIVFEQEDSLSGKGTYEMRILANTPDRLVVDTRNLTTLRYFMIPMFHPGDVQSIYFLERESKDVWRYYNLARIGASANALAQGHTASAINRAVALYRHLANIPTNQDPPAAP